LARCNRSFATPTAEQAAEGLWRRQRHGDRRIFDGNTDSARCIRSAFEGSFTYYTLSRRNSKSGIATTKKDIDLIHQRLAAEKRDYDTKKGRKSMKIKRKAAKSANVTDEGTGNVFADLGLPNADQELMKARLRQALLLFGKDLGRT
jgi:hypothetical protein